VDAASGQDSPGPLYLGDETLVGSLWRTLAGAPFVAQVRFGEPQKAEGRDRRQWAQELHAAVDALRRGTQEQPTSGRRGRRDFAEDAEKFRQ
jgi:1-acyl-sn-glycerol-3-phosphate acyltransferase